MQTGVVNFAHFSVKEFFLSGPLNSLGFDHYHLKADSGHSLIARACIAVLFHIPEDDADYTTTDSGTPSDSFLRYAAVHWMGHVRDAGADPSLDFLADQILDDTGPYFLRWLDISDPRLSVTNVRPVLLWQPEGVDAGPDPLYYASMAGLSHQLRLITQKPSVDVNKVFSLKTTALHHASLGGHIEAMQVLLDRGANVNAISDQYQAATPVEAASSNGHLKAVRWLIGHGAALVGESCVALHTAAANGHLDIIRLLIAHGADPNFDWVLQYYHRSYATPLWAAADYGQLSAAQLLIELGGDVNAGTERTPFDYPSGEYGATPTTPLEVAITAGHDEITRLYLLHGANITEVTLLLAVRTQYRNLDIVRLVLERGADPNHDCAGYRYLSPLAEAAKSGDFELAELLLTHGAKINYVPSRPGGCLPPLYAAINDEPSSLEMVRFLLERGASPNVYREKYPGPTYEDTALEKAKRLELDDIVDLLSASIHQNAST